MKVFNNKKKRKKKSEKKFVVKFTKEFVVDLDGHWSFDDFISENDLEDKEITEKHVAKWIAENHEDALEAFYELVDNSEMDINETLDVEKLTIEKERGIVDIGAILEHVSEVELREVMLEKGMIKA